MSRTRRALFGSTLVAYAAIVVAVLTTSPLVRLDWQVMLFRPYMQWPSIHAFLDYFVVLGQRGPTAVIVAAWLGWRSWRHRTLRPLLVLGASLLMLNMSVGAVKYGLSRLGPHYATTIGSNELFAAGGDIFPSGHTANAVVTWGVLAYLATTPFARRLGSVISAMLALGVGMTTIYLGTHWVSDVLSGWCAGLLVLLALPWCEPGLARAEWWLLTRWALLRRRSGRAPVISAPVYGSAADLFPSRPDTGPAVRRPVGAVSRSAPAPTAARTPHVAVRPHVARHERATVPPAGSRRPLPERPARQAPAAVQKARGRGPAGI